MLLARPVGSLLPNIPVPVSLQEEEIRFTNQVTWQMSGVGSESMGDLNPWSQADMGASGFPITPVSVWCLQHAYMCMSVYIYTCIIHRLAYTHICIQRPMYIILTYIYIHIYTYKHTHVCI